VDLVVPAVRAVEGGTEPADLDRFHMGCSAFVR
jgi:hypothetical protein